MSTDAMTQYFRNKQASEDRKVARKIAALDRVAEVDARKELTLLNLQIKTAQEEGYKLDGVVANKQVRVEALRNSLNVLSDGFAFKDVPSAERTDYTKPDGGYANAVRPPKGSIVGPKSNVVKVSQTPDGVGRIFTTVTPPNGAAFSYMI